MTDVAAILNQISETLARGTSSREETAELVSRTAGTLLDSTCVLWLTSNGSRELSIAATYDPSQPIAGPSQPIAGPSQPVTDPSQPAAGPSQPGLPNPAGRLSGWRTPLQDVVFADTDDRGVPFVVRGVTWQAAGEPEPALLTAVALRAGNATTGALGIIRPAALGDLDDLGLALLRQLGDRAALALDNVSLQVTADHETSRRHRAESAHQASEQLTVETAAGQAALADLGRWALIGLDYADLVDDAVEVLRAHMSLDVVHVFDAAPESDLLILSASSGHPVGDHDWTAAEPTSSPASFALVSQQTVVSDDLRDEARFDVPELWSAAEVVSDIEVPIPGPDMPAGVVGAGRSYLSPFTEEEANFVRAVASVLAAAGARRRAEGVIRAQAVRDPLTGLPNRFLLADHSARRAAPTAAFPPLSGAERSVLVIDIDRFKEINDTLGHAIGDLVLLEVSRRLSYFGDPVELVARLGSDEFALVTRSLGSAESEEHLAARLLSVLGEPFDAGGVKLRLRASIGIGPADVDAAGIPLDVPVLLRRAESAMYQAKSDHVGFCRYSEDIERTSLLRLTLAGELADAIDQGQLQLDYQPKLSTVGGWVTGVEALVRWQHPTRGLLLPDHFVPLAEQTGIIRELTNWVLARALAECASWRRAGFPVPVAVNLSAGTVQDASLVETIMAALARAGLPTSAIELEITESAIMGNPGGALRTLEALAAKGVRFALDDFGTGYSSLSYLQRLPVASVKIDKSFVSPLGERDNTVARAIVTAVIELGHSLGLEVIAEGVDSRPVLDAVTSMGCDAVQGFYLAVPMASHVLRSWIASRPAGEQTGAPPGRVVAG